MALINSQFPFERLYNDVDTDSGTHIEIRHLPMQEAVNDPYWLAWSLALYGGIAMIAVAVLRIKK